MLTRPREDTVELADELTGIGVESLIEPLLHIDYVDAPPPDLDGVQAVLVTSANGVRAFGRLSPGRDIAVYAVGDASARAARDLGFTHVESASGDVRALAELVHERLQPDDGSLLHVAGTRLAGDLAGSLEAHGYSYRREVLYGAEKATVLTLEATEALTADALDGVVLYSPRTADSLIGLLQAAGLDGKARGMTAFCLSAAVSERAGVIDWGQIVVAAHPTQAALIETIRAHT